MKINSFVVLAEFRAKPERVEHFASYLDQHAAWSRQEPGCLTFDVCQDAQDSGLFLLYEVYSSEAAYQAHRKQPYHPRFFEVVRDMLVQSGESLFVSRRVFERRSEIPAER